MHVLCCQLALPLAALCDEVHESNGPCSPSDVHTCTHVRLSKSLPIVQQLRLYSEMQNLGGSISGHLILQ